MNFDPITLEHDLTPVDYPTGTACAFCGCPGCEGADELDVCDDPVAIDAGYQPRRIAAFLTPCCDKHRQPMCDRCRDLPGSIGHRNPAKLT